MSSENNTSNNSPEVKLHWDKNKRVAIRQKIYRVTEKQLQKILERKIEARLAEGLSFKTDDEKRAFLKPGNIITFKDKLPGFPNKQIAIAKIQRTKSGAIKLINSFGSETPWFSNESELLDSIDFEWMQNNIITKEYE